MFDELLFRLRSLFRRERVENELDDELRFHFERETEKYVASGLTRGEALRRARLAFGGVDQIKEECRDARGLSWVETGWQDTRYAARMFRKSPGFSAVAVLTLALGIGASTAIFTLIDAILLKPLPYPRSQQLVGVELTPMALDPNVHGIAPEDYFVFREQGRTFQGIGIYSETDTDHDVNITGFAEPERVHALHATHDVLSLLAVPPMLGRVFSAVDDAPSAAPTVVLTYPYWQRKFGGDAAVVGKTLIVDGGAREIIGVMPREFRFLQLQDMALILPLQLDRNKLRLGSFGYFGIARLKDGATAAAARADMDRLMPLTFSALPPGPGLSVDLLRNARLTPSVQPLKQEVAGNLGTLLWVLMAGVGMVLLIACANVANLLLVRTAGRRHELALRVALGAGSRRIAAQLLRESAVLGLLGGALGLMMSWLAVRLIVRLAPAGLPRIEEIGIDLPALLFALATALFTSLLFGLIPVCKHAGAAGGLPSSGRTLTASRERHRVQGTLVAVQVALALVLLVCSGLMMRTFRVLSRVNPGFTADEVQTFRISISPADVSDDAAVPRIEQQIQDKLAAIPGVSSVAFANFAPMDGTTSGLDNVFAADHASREQGTVPPLRATMFVSPGYLQTMRIRLVAGRDLNWAETYNKLPVVLISENFAREYWGTPSAALGKRIRPSWSPDWREVVGVVADVRNESVDKAPQATVYWPVMMANYRGKPLRVNRFVSFVVRTPLAGSEQFLKQVRAAVRSVDSKAPLARIATLSFFFARSMARTSFTLVMLGIAAGMALLLGTVGLYGVIAYSVSQRTREIGVRMALGAQPRGIVALIVRRGMGIIGVGLVAGLAAALLLTRLLSSMLYGVRPQDPLTYGGVVLLLATVALAACYLPARRATRVEPLIALRYE
jgi:predicted permease